MAEPGRRLLASSSESTAARKSYMCELCGDQVDGWYEVAMPTRQGSAKMRICRVCFWRSPARALTGWGAGAHWVAAPD